jgi:CcmD family protein
MSGNAVVMGVALLVWALLFFYIVRVERRIRELEKR